MHPFGMKILLCLRFSSGIKFREISVHVGICKQRLIAALIRGRFAVIQQTRKYNVFLRRQSFHLNSLKKFYGKGSAGSLASAFNFNITVLTEYNVKCQRQPDAIPVLVLGIFKPFKRLN